MTEKYLLCSYKPKDQIRNELKCDPDLWVSAVWIEISLILYCLILFIFFVVKFFINLCQCCSYCLSCKCCTNEQDLKVEQMEKYNPEEEVLNLSRPLMSPMQNYNVEIGTDDISTSTVENTNNYMNNGASISQSETLELTQSHEKIDIVSNVAQGDDIVDDDESKFNEKITDELL